MVALVLTVADLEVALVDTLAVPDPEKPDVTPGTPMDGPPLPSSHPQNAVSTVASIGMHLANALPRGAHATIVVNWATLLWYVSLLLRFLIKLPGPLSCLILLRNLADNFELSAEWTTSLQSFLGMRTWN